MQKTIKGGLELDKIQQILPPRPGIAIIFMSKRKNRNNFLIEVENQQIYLSPSRKSAKHVVPSPEKPNTGHQHSLKIVKSWEKF